MPRTMGPYAMFNVASGRSVFCAGLGGVIRIFALQGDGDGNTFSVYVRMPVQRVGVSTAVTVTSCTPGESSAGFGVSVNVNDPAPVAVKPGLYGWPAMASGSVSRPMVIGMQIV